jgi:lipopolysaccharide export system permease protein
MNLLERYVLRKVSLALVVTLLALSGTIWLSQSLREFDLVTARGQSFLTFFHVTALVFPSLVVVIAPVATLVAVIHVLSGLNTDSELVVMASSGARPVLLLKPILLVGLATALVVAAMTLYYAPLTQRMGRELLARINTDIVTSVLREGQFMTLTPGLTINIRDRGTDGVLHGVFVSDDREDEETVTYLAERGAVLDNPLGLFLVMQDGVIQRSSKTKDEISIIQFRSYAFDLSNFSDPQAVENFRPAERDTPYLLHPDPDDAYFQQYPARFRAEFHDRVTAPLFVLVFALVPLAFLGQARTTRRGRGLTIVMAVTVTLAIRGAGLVLAGAIGANEALVPLIYAVPVGADLIAIAAILAGVRLQTPEAVLRIIDVLARPIVLLLRRPAADSR